MVRKAITTEVTKYHEGDPKPFAQALRLARARAPVPTRSNAGVHLRNLSSRASSRYSVLSSLRQCFSDATSVRTGAVKDANCSILLSVYSLSPAALKRSES